MGYTIKARLAFKPGFRFDAVMLPILLFGAVILAIQVVAGLTFDPSQQFSRGRPSPWAIVRRDAEPELFWGCLAIQVLVVGVMPLIAYLGTNP